MLFLITNLDSSIFLRNACRNQETDNLQAEIIRNQASQYSEPSSRRGSVGVSIKDHLICKQL
jgi:hypothetical protein